MIKYVIEAPPNSKEISNGFLRAKTPNGATARLLLSMPQGEFVSREIVSRLVLFKMSNPEIVNYYDLETVYYSLGEPEPEPTGDFGTFRVPLKVYLLKKRQF